MKTHNSRHRRIRLIIGAAIILAGAVSTFAQKPYAISEIQGDKPTPLSFSCR
ncbi:MAG: hypothetical protein ABJA02_12880 [Acidobacteriota bacterium]